MFGKSQDRSGRRARTLVPWNLDKPLLPAHNPPMPDEITPAQFIAKWSRAELSERAASQEHFIDLCRLLGQPTPAEHDSTGTEYTFEKGVSVTGAASAGSRGEHGFADVWWRGKFALEYKRKGKYETLAEAYRQLLQYREALENPPLLIASDIARTEIHTNFTGTKKEIHAIPLDGIGHPDNLSKLRRVFTDPDSFKPSLTTWKLTEQAAAEFAKIAEGTRRRRIRAQRIPKRTSLMFPSFGEAGVSDRPSAAGVRPHDRKAIRDP